MKFQEAYGKLKRSVLGSLELIDNQLLALSFLLLVYHIYYTFYFFFISNGFQQSILERHHLETFNFEGIYQNESFVLASLKYYYFIIPVFCACLFLFLFSKKTAWHSIESDFLNPTKYFILFIVLFTTWFCTFSEYNYYFDKPYYFDRLLIIALACLLYFYTWLLPLFIGLIILWLSQYNFPIGPARLVDKKIIYELLILFFSYLSVKTIFKIKIHIFWMLVFSLIASNYFISAIYKMQLGPSWYQWFVENELWVHVRGAFCKHWMSYMSDNQKDIFVSVAKNGNFLIVLYTLVVELLALFILFKRRFSIILLSLLCLFHLGVFIESGIFFWKWILFNIALIVLLSIYKNAFNQIFTKTNLLLSVFIICASNWFFDPVKLGWWDSPLYEKMSYEVTDTSGKTYTLAGNQMRPYEQISYTKLNYLVPDSIAIVSKPKDDYEYFRTMKNLKIADVDLWIQKNKRSTYNKQKALNFDKFVSQYFNSYNSHLKSNDIFIPKFATLDHVWTGQYPKNKFPCNSCVKSFKVKFLQYYQTLEKSILINENCIYEKQF